MTYYLAIFNPDHTSNYIVVEEAAGIGYMLEMANTHTPQHPTQHPYQKELICEKKLRNFSPQKYDLIRNRAVKSGLFHFQILG
jgi:hypothetical protein